MTTNLSPMMQQYINIKEKHKDHILFFRLGDFYEMFYDDAKLCSKELDLTLTSKSCGKEEKAPMCGVPQHSCDAYIQRLIKKGYKIAICEQTEKSTQSNKLVARDVVRVITPGTIIETDMLDDSKNNYILSLFLYNDIYNLAFCDISTGSIELTTSDENNLLNEIGRFQPKEILLDVLLKQNEKLISFLKDKLLCLINYRDYSLHSNYEYREIIKNQFDNTDFIDYILNSNSYTICVGNLIYYLKDTQMTGLDRINQFSFYNNSQFMSLPYSTKINLELLETIRYKDKKGSLIWILDNTSTPMGKRLLRNFLEKPLLDVYDINERLNATEELINNYKFRNKLINNLKLINDIERLLTKVVYGNILPRELISLKMSFSCLDSINDIISSLDSDIFKKMSESFDSLNDIVLLIDKSINEDCPATLKDSGYIKYGYDKNVDNLRNIINNSKYMLSELAERVKKETGIKNLKISYNKVFGYFFEVTKTNKDLIPKNFVIRQTLSNCERYVTDELKELENNILNASENILEVEKILYENIVKTISLSKDRIQKVSNTIAFIDVILSFSLVSYKNNYTKPIISDSTVINIEDGRHPVIEKLTNDIFVPNDVYIDCDNNMINIITGPNMAGKSTYMRQVAIIVIMAQIGCFVPAKYAEIGLVDKIFTRVGASDDLSSGMSTFMVEMTEVAEILNNSTNKSLLILDEIGRGTSTYDGMSIAKSVVEYIGNNIKAKTLFATHYHELTSMQDEYSFIKNYNICVKRKNDTIVFLRKIVRGAAMESYGIDVANLAGVPLDVVKRAKNILMSLEDKGFHSIHSEFKIDNYQNNSYGHNNEIRDTEIEVLNYLESLDINVLTPVESMMVLSDVLKKLKFKD